MRRVLVTGASGFIGRNIVAALRADPAIELRATSLSGDGVDLCSFEQAQRLIADAAPDAVVHCVGARHGSPGHLRDRNLRTLHGLLRALAAVSPTPRLVLMGSAAEYGPAHRGGRIAESAPCRPRSPYGRTKLAGTRLALCHARRLGLQVTVLRLFNVVGEGMHGLLGEVIDAVNGAGPPIDWRKEAHSLPLVRDFVSVEDAARICRRVLEIAAPPPVLNVCTGVGRSFAEVLDEIEAESGRRLGHPVPPPNAHGIVGDPTLCEEATGFLPSADLSPTWRKAIGSGGGRK